MYRGHIPIFWELYSIWISHFGGFHHFLKRVCFCRRHGPGQYSKIILCVYISYLNHQTFDSMSGHHNLQRKSQILNLDQTRWQISFVSGLIWDKWHGPNHFPHIKSVFGGSDWVQRGCGSQKMDLPSKSRIWRRATTRPNRHLFGPIASPHTSARQNTRHLWL